VHSQHAAGGAAAVAARVDSLEHGMGLDPALLPRMAEQGTPGAPADADAVIYDAAPRADLSVLDHPRTVILRGRLVHP
jgi:imidazolonepropionase-like amidohydrolase